MLLCQSCPSQFVTPWSLLQHAQRVHALRIYLDAVKQPGCDAAVDDDGDDDDDGGDASLDSRPVAPVAGADEGVAEGLAGGGAERGVGGGVTAGREAGRGLTTVCCDDQDCGVTVVPITHESPRKCCNAVVPKRRKRHMETKHVAAGRARRDRAAYGPPRNIYIDLVPTIEDVAPPRGGGAEPSPGGAAASLERSVIIEPGKTFSIPLRCTLAPPTLTTSQLNGMLGLRGLAEAAALSLSMDDVATASMSRAYSASAVFPKFLLRLFVFIAHVDFS